VDADVVVQVLSAVLVLGSVAATITAAVRARRLRERITARPDGRLWFYRRFVFRTWPAMVLLPAIAWSSRSLTAADLGWAWPHGVVGYLCAGYAGIMLLVGGLRARGRMRRGHTFARRQRILFMLPRTPRERWWALAVSVTAGVTEEAIYRGALPGIGLEVYHLPYLLAAAAALVLFAAAHLYQGGPGVVGSACVGLLYTFIYVQSGSLVLPILLHVTQDVVALILVPAEATPREADPGPAEQPQPAAATAGEAATPARTTTPAWTIPRPPTPDEPPALRTAVPD
jgi:uncharacterized protein